MNLLPDEPEETQKPPIRPGIRVLRAGLLLAGSALLGGLAVVLWHRKSLDKLRQPLPVPESASVGQDAEGE
jgi:hypothetical protein